MSEFDTAVKVRQRVTWAAQERAQWLELFKGSGKTAAEFCRDNGLSPATLSFWLRQEARGDASAECDGEFVEVPLLGLAAPAIAPMVTVHLPCGARLEIGAGADAQWVGTLLRAMQPAGVSSCSG